MARDLKYITGQTPPPTMVGQDVDQLITELAALGFLPDYAKNNNGELVPVNATSRALTAADLTHDDNGNGDGTIPLGRITVNNIQRPYRLGDSKQQYDDVIAKVMEEFFGSRIHNTSTRALLQSRLTLKNDAASGKISGRIRVHADESKSHRGFWIQIAERNLVSNGSDLRIKDKHLASWPIAKPNGEFEIYYAKPGTENPLELDLALYLIVPPTPVPADIVVDDYILAIHPILYNARQPEDLIYIKAQTIVPVVKEPAAPLPVNGFELIQTSDPVGDYDTVRNKCLDRLKAIVDDDDAGGNAVVTDVIARKLTTIVDDQAKATFLASESVVNRSGRPKPPLLLPGEDDAFDRIFTVVNRFEESALARAGWRVKQLGLLAQSRKCENATQAARTIAIEVPTSAGSRHLVEIAVSQEGEADRIALSKGFLGVPAAYFYATAFQSFIATEVTYTQRLKTATEAGVERLMRVFTEAKTAALLGENDYQLVDKDGVEVEVSTLPPLPLKVNAAGAARRLLMLRDVTIPLAPYYTTDPAEITSIVTLLTKYRDWSPAEPEAAFWTFADLPDYLPDNVNVNPVKKECQKGHLLLAMYLVADGHRLLVEKIQKDTTLTNVQSLSSKTDKDWFDFMAIGPITKFNHTGTAISGDATYITVNSSSTTSRSGNGAQITVTRTSGTTLYGINLTSGGADYEFGDFLTWAGTLFGGNTPANDIVIQVTEVNGDLNVGLVSPSLRRLISPSDQRTLDQNATKAAISRHLRKFVEPATAGGVNEPTGPVATPPRSTPTRLAVLKAFLDGASRPDLAAALNPDFHFVDFVPNGTPNPISPTYSDGSDRLQADGTLKLDTFVVLNELLDTASGNNTIVRKSLEATLQQLNLLFRLTNVVGVEALNHISVMEGLYSRGFVTAKSISKLTDSQFRVAIAGTNSAQFGEKIHEKARQIAHIDPTPTGRTGGFRPVNADGLLTSCDPPEYLSPFGYPAYLRDLLLTKPDGSTPLKDLIKTRRGDVGSLEVTLDNATTKVPTIDLVNEALESLVAQATGTPPVVPFNTIPRVNANPLPGPGVNPVPIQTSKSEAELLCTPERSTPSAGDDHDAAYERLKTEFTSPALPYNQPLDVVRTYAELLATGRYESMRTTRENITEYVLDPNIIPMDFDEFLRRYPVKIEIAREYLHISEEEYVTLFTQRLGQQVHRFYGFNTPLVTKHDGTTEDWKETVKSLPELRERLGMSSSLLLEFAANSLFTTLSSPATMLLDELYLEKLMVIVRLYRILNRTHAVSVLEVVQIILAIPLHDSADNINPDFVRQLCAVFMLSDDFDLPIADCLKFNTQEAKEKLAQSIQAKAKRIRHECRDCAVDRNEEIRTSDFVHLAPLAGFSDETHAFLKPTHILRFAEVCLKVAASDFTVEEIVFLFVNEKLTDQNHIELFKQDNPFPLPPPPPPSPPGSTPPPPLGPDTLASFNLPWTPANNHPFSLNVLRLKLLQVWLQFDESKLPLEPTWNDVSAAFREIWEYVYEGNLSKSPTGGHTKAPLDALNRLVRERPSREAAYRTPLMGSRIDCWEKFTPFAYCDARRELSVSRPLRDVDAIHWLAGHETTDEAQEVLDREAVDKLHALARDDIHTLRWLFPNYKEAVVHLIENACASSRYRFALKSLLVFRHSLDAIVAHLISHITNDLIDGECPPPAHASLVELSRALLVSIVCADDSDGKEKPLDALTVMLGLRGNGLVQVVGTFPRSTSRPGLPLSRSFTDINLESGPVVVTTVDDLRFPSVNPDNTETSWAKNVPLFGAAPTSKFPSTSDVVSDLDLANGFTEKNQNAQPYVVAWHGLLFVERTEFIRFACRLNGNSDAGCRVKIWTPTTVEFEEEFEEWGSDNGSHKGERLVEQPAYDVREVRAGFYEIEVLFYDRTIDCNQDFSSSFSLLKATGSSREEAITESDKNAYREIHSSEFYLPTKLEDIQRNPTDPQRDISRFRDRSSVRDIRRNYQRLFKCLVLAYRLRLKGNEFQYFALNSSTFKGKSFTRTPFVPTDDDVVKFNVNQLPVGDPFAHNMRLEVKQSIQNPPTETSAAWMDLWERLFDYVAVRESLWCGPAADRSDFWRIFVAAVDNEPLESILQHYLKVEPGHVRIVVSYLTDADTTEELNVTDFKHLDWLTRVSVYDQWIHTIEDCSAIVEDITFYVVNPENNDTTDLNVWVLGKLKPDHDNVFKMVTGKSIPSSNLRQVNDGLRTRGRTALIAYLCSVDRFAISQDDANNDIGWARHPHDLSDRLLIDVEVHLGEASSRIGNAVTAAETYLRRCRLGSLLGAKKEKELVANVAADLKTHLKSFSAWKSHARRVEYPENSIVLEAYWNSRDDRAFRILSDRLRKDTLSVPQEVTGIPERALLAFVEERPFATTSNLISHPNHYDRMLVTARRPAEVHLTNLEEVAVRNPDEVVVRNPDKADRLRLWRDETLEVQRPFLQVQGSVGAGDEFFFWLVAKDEFEHTKQEEPWKEVVTISHHDFVRLRWCRKSYGIRRQAHTSIEGIVLTTDNGSVPAILTLLGRNEDSLFLQPDSLDNVFRFDIATNSVSIIPKADAVAVATNGGLGAFPHFVADPLASLPDTVPHFAPANLVADYLRFHHHYESASDWLRFLFDPILFNCDWRQSEDNLSTANRAVLIRILEMMLDWSDCDCDPIRRTQLIEFVGHVLGKPPLCCSELPAITTSNPESEAGKIPTVGDKGSPFANPALNPKLVALWARLGSAQHACPSRMDEEDLHAWCVPRSPYRFTSLQARAKELCVELKDLGGKLQAAYERADAEYLATLRTLHESQLLELTLDVRRDQLRESDWQLQSLNKAKEMADFRQSFFQDLIARGLIHEEKEYFVNLRESIQYLIGSHATDTAGSISALFPDLFNGVLAGLGGGPLVFAEMGGGDKVTLASQIVARVLSGMSQLEGIEASIVSMEGSHERREEEWRHQVGLITIEIEQIKLQIRAAERRKEIALRELNNHQQQIDNMQEVTDFCDNKFTNHDLLFWLCRQTAGIYREMYRLALDAAHDAERAFQFESDFTSERFIHGSTWNDLREGLLAGEGLMLSLQRMERRYRELNRRDLELTKSISLREHFPLEFQLLRWTGACEIELPEWLFDLDHPGHYMRRLRTVSLTIPCIIGPHQTVNCTLTLLCSSVRIDSSVACAKAVGRVVTSHAATSSIATSSGQNDSGMFELNFQDERYLPFEGAGAVGRWRLELPHDCNWFDFEALSDVVIRLNYTALDGGRALREIMVKEAHNSLVGPTRQKLIRMRQEMPSQWSRFAGQHACRGSACSAKLEFPLDATYFPWFAKRYSIHVKRIGVYYKRSACSACQGAQDIYFAVSKSKPRKKIAIAATLDTSIGVYHGSIAVSDIYLSPNTSQEAMTFDFSDNNISDVVIAVEYTLEKPKKALDCESECHCS